LITETASAKSSAAFVAESRIRVAALVDCVALAEYTVLGIRRTKHMAILRKPGDEAPVNSAYEPIDSAGKAVPLLVTVARGDRLPKLPVGFRWRLTA
jgi:hypothetical protein